MTEVKFRLRFGSGFLGFLWLLLPSVSISVAGVELLMANRNSEAASVVIAFSTFAIFFVLIGLYLLGTWKLSRNAALRGKGKIRVVKVRKEKGPGFYLGAPIDGGFRPDPDFDATVLEIQSFWRSVRGRQPHPWPRAGSVDTIAPG